MNWIKQLFSRRRLYNDLSEEIHEHLEEKIEELAAMGNHSPASYPNVPSSFLFSDFKFLISNVQNCRSTLDIDSSLYDT